MKSQFKQIITAFVLASLLALALFSFALIMHEQNGLTSGDCPFSTLGTSLCPENSVAVAIHYISAYHAFFNVPLGTALSALIFSLIFAVSVALVIFIRLPLLLPPTFSRVFFDSLPVNSYSRKIIRWLSLFENSPPIFNRA